MKNISIITPIYNGNRFIQCLRRMIENNAKLCNDLAKVEWIISNDDPTHAIRDVTSSIVSVVTINSRINTGTQQARIRGVDVCSGNYILMLDQDDRIEDLWLKSQLEHMGDADAVVCNGLADGKMFYGDNLRPSFNDALTINFNLANTCGFLPGQVLMKREAISDKWKKNLFKTNHCDDYYLWLCMMLEGKKFVENTDILYEHITTGRNQSLNRVIWYQSMKEMISFLVRDKMVSESQVEMLARNVDSETMVCLQERDWELQKKMLLHSLLEIYEEERNISDVIKKNNYSNVAIYGMGECGLHLYNKLTQEGFSVKCFIDRAQFFDPIIPVYKIDKIPQETDCIINTLTRDEEAIEEYIIENYQGIRMIHMRDLMKQA